MRWLTLPATYDAKPCRRHGGLVHVPQHPEAAVWRDGVVEGRRLLGPGRWCSRYVIQRIVHPPFLS